MNIPDGDPVDMSQFRLGERYSAADMYRDFPELGPGSRVAFEKDGVIYTDTIESVSMRSGTPAIYPTLTVWQRLVRRFTPARWRKPLKPIREAGSATVSVQIGGDPNPLERHQATLKQMQQAVDALTAPPSPQPHAEHH